MILFECKAPDIWAVNNHRNTQRKAPSFLILSLTGDKEDSIVETTRSVKATKAVNVVNNAVPAEAINKLITNIVTKLNALSLGVFTKS